VTVPPTLLAALAATEKFTTEITETFLGFDTKDAKTAKEFRHFHT
jgi:hypothetical protein